MSPVSGQPAAIAGSADEAAIADKVQFLSAPAAYAERPPKVEIKETHMSWVFLAGESVFKLKKPVRYPQLDFSTLAAREHNCREEIRLNARLAPQIYRGALALRRTRDGRLTLGSDGEVVDWLVVMRRLPEDRMLDAMLARGMVTGADLDRLAAVLSAFYARAERAAIAPEAYADRFIREQAINRDILTRRAFAVDPQHVPGILSIVDRALIDDRELLFERARAGQVVDGHGDLRPEHVCLTEPIVIFDCLEFNADLRLADPFDELAFLGMECAFLGVPWVGPAMIERLGAQLGARPPDRLVRLYTAFRAVLRARLSLAHLLDPVPREPAKWAPQAARYLRLAELALVGE